MARNVAGVRPPAVGAARGAHHALARLAAIRQVLRSATDPAAAFAALDEAAKALMALERREGV
jgi:hypothetical protein